MKATFRTGAAMVALIAGLGVAAAQQPPASTTPPAAANDTQHTSGSTSPPTPNKATQTPQTAPEQGEPESTPGKGGATNAGLPTTPQDSPVFRNGALAVPGASTEGATVPSKFSQKNAALDKLPMLKPR